MRRALLGLTFLLFPGLAMAQSIPDYRAADCTFHEPVRTIAYKVIRKLPHDRKAFTQGLVYYLGALYESSGLKGMSRLTRISTDDGRILNSHSLQAEDFAEGLAQSDGQLLQLTWKSGKLLHYDPHTLTLIEQRRIPGESWGLEARGGKLWVSDGSETIRIYSESTLELLEKVTIHTGDEVLRGVNELEFAHGSLYMNIMPTDCIARVNPGSGEVEGWLDFSALLGLQDRESSRAVLNGVAFNPDNGHFYVTGKLWPYIYEIAVQPRSGSNTLH